MATVVVARWRRWRRGRRGACSILSGPVVEGTGVPVGGEREWGSCGRRVVREKGDGQGEGRAWVRGNLAPRGVRARFEDCVEAGEAVRDEGGKE